MKNSKIKIAAALVASAARNAKRAHSRAKTRAVEAAHAAKLAADNEQATATEVEAIDKIQDALA